MLKMINAPTTEPVTLTELKLSLRIDDTALDSELAAALSAARGEAEHFTARSLAPQRWRLSRDDFWIGGLRLPRGPVDGVVQVEFLNPDGDWQTIAASNYSLRDDILHFDLEFQFPDFLKSDNVIRVTYDTGTWDPPVPFEIQTAVKMLAQSKVDALQDQPAGLRERAFALLRPFRFDSGFRAA